VAVGEGCSRVEVARGAGVAVRAAEEPTTDGVATGRIIRSQRSLVEKILTSPRIETTPIAIGIKRARSNEGRGCIPDKVLPRLYPHSFHSTLGVRLLCKQDAVSQGLSVLRIACLCIPSMLADDSGLSARCLSDALLRGNIFQRTFPIAARDRTQRDEK
jgi:hypothetical protein